MNLNDLQRALQIKGKGYYKIDNYIDISYHDVINIYIDKNIKVCSIGDTVTNYYDMPKTAAYIINNWAKETIEDHEYKHKMMQSYLYQLFNEEEPNNAN